MGINRMDKILNHQIIAMSVGSNCCPHQLAGAKCVTTYIWVKLRRPWCKRAAHVDRVRDVLSCAQVAPDLELIVH